MRFCFIIFVLLSLLIKQADSQVTADFSVNQSSGCNPLNVIFTDESQGNIASWQWDFGNGNTGSAQNVQEYYNTPGTYTVSLVVSDGTNTDTAYMDIEVYAIPEVFITTSTGSMGCIPLNVSFEDSTILGDTTIADWSWTFGDGGGSTQSNPNHTYNEAGNYSVYLKVVDENGCWDEKTFPDYVRVSDLPEVNFTVDNSYSCTDNFNVNFTNNSSGTGELTYLWDFGDSSYSTDSCPSHTFEDYGLYTVTLSVTDENGCSDSLTQSNFIQVIELNTSFSLTSDTVCSGNNLPITNTSTGAYYYQWTFGTNDTITDENPAYSYSTPGNYEINLTAYSQDSLCVEIYTDTIFVDNVQAYFVKDTSIACSVPFEVAFSDSSTNAISWQWDFGDGNTSNQQNDTNIYINEGEYQVNLSVTSPAGCTSTYSDSVIIDFPDVVFDMDTTMGCIPLTVNFSENSSSISPIVDWNWDFGDGDTSTLPNPSHTYNTDGNMFVYLQVTDSLGCSNTDSLLITTGDTIDFSFTVNADTACSRDMIEFDFYSDDSINSNYWSWDFGDGGVSNEEDPQYQYTDTVGDFDISLVVGYNGCLSDTIDSISMIHIIGPAMDISPDFSCDSVFTHFFQCHLASGTRIYWDFGDGISDSLIFNTDTTVDFNIEHTYDSTSTGDFNVVFTSYNDSASQNCVFVDTVPIYVGQVLANFVTSDSICANEEVMFIADSSDHTIDYQWDFDDGTLETTVNDTIYHIFPQRGIYNVELIVTDSVNCSEIITKPVKVYQPVAGFISDTIGCIPFNLNLTDTTVTDTGIVSWLWDFGNGDSSLLQNPTTTEYTELNDYTIKLKVTDSIGCMDSTSLTIRASKPKTLFDVNDRYICVGDSVRFNNQTSSFSGFGLEYEWNFGDGNTSNMPDTYVWHTYNDTGTFSVSLTAIDTVLNCDSVFTRLDYINVQAYPDVDFMADTTYYGCYPHSFFFTNLTQPFYSSYIDSVSWYFGDNQPPTSYLDSLLYTYNYPGTYDVSLRVVSTNGCISDTTKTEYIEVGGPYANFNFPDTACMGEKVWFNLSDTMNLSHYQWFFRDGNVTTEYNDTSVSHVYEQYGWFKPVLILQSDLEGTCPIDFEDSIYIHKIITDFTGADTAVCGVPYTVSFNDNSSADNPINSYEWNFGDGNTSTQENPQNTYTSDSTYYVTLISQSDYGCSDTITKPFTVYALPVVYTCADTTICTGDSIIITVGGGSEYIWTPDQDLSNDSISNPYAYPETTIQYNVLVTDTNSCQNTGTVTVYVQEYPYIDVSNDTTIFLGDTIQINASSGQGVSFVWSPNEMISCTNCASPNVSPFKTVEYTVIATDSNACFSPDATVIVEVRSATVDVPKAFTPDGNPPNNEVHVNGIGLKELVEFKIYNRWGELVFETTDLEKGWDGSYKGNPQNADTYVYIVKARTFDGRILNKKGQILLIR
ncbi:MAG: PKD domain-containing protein [Bacteroidota bacterium]|nr:PKD domain-containing protein [Bacteroidota bacterium]